MGSERGWAEHQSHAPVPKTHSFEPLSLNLRSPLELPGETVKKKPNVWASFPTKKNQNRQGRETAGHPAF